MSANDLTVEVESAATESSSQDAADLLSPLIQAPTHAARANSTPHVAAIHGVVLGELLALTDDGQTPLVRFPGQPGTRAIAARSSVDLHGSHIGQPLVLMFERGDPARPIVMGVLRGAAGWPEAERPGRVDVDADGQRLVVNAKEQLVLRCGKASITLTKAGKVLIEGAYVLSRSTGVNRIKGGSVQLN